MEPSAMPSDNKITAAIKAAVIEKQPGIHILYPPERGSIPTQIE
jgi:hypothetical protein